MLAIPLHHRKMYKSSAIVSSQSGLWILMATVSPVACDERVKKTRGGAKQ